ncbi:unnamed protein product [Echinostoma caproni]|uniref:Homeobox domain-containing protein n=1 Tax=Echinostoma caproni TaxID=27848 RepID=A0A183AB77_9TREM|nr:unnamed protein product [Echinostoma caproni]
MQPSNEVTDSHSDEDIRPSAADNQAAKRCDSPADRDASMEAKLDYSTTVTSNKRSPAVHESWSETGSDYPSPKRSRTADIPPDLVESTPRSSGTPLMEVNPPKSTIPQSLPLILSIGNPGNSIMSPQSASQASSTITVCPQTLNSTATTSVSSSSPFIGQLIPLCGLSDSLLCGVSSALLTNGTNSTTSSLTAHSLMGNTLSLPVLDAQTAFTTPVSGSTWLLTNQPNTITAHMTSGQSHLNQLPPTVLVPVPAALGAENLLGAAARHLVTSSADTNGGTISANPPIHSSTAGQSSTSAATTTTNTIMSTITNNTGLNSLRVSDVLEALKSFAAGGNLAASISLPVAGASTSPVTSTVSASSTGTTPSFFGFSTPSRNSDLLSISGGPKTNLMTHGTTVINPGGLTLVSSNSNTTSNNSGGNNNSTFSTTQLPAGTHVVSASGLLSQLAMAAAAVNVSTSEPSNKATESTGAINGLTATVIPTGTPEQALDMSVRSGLISLNALAPMSNGTWLSKSTDGNSNSPQLTLALDTVDGKPIRSDQTTVHGVMEALNAALKGSLQKSTRLTISSDGTAGYQTTGDGESGVLETGSHLISGSTKNLITAIDPDQVLNTSGLLKTTTSGTQSIIVPFPALSLSSTGCSTPDLMTDPESGRSSVSQLLPPPPPLQSVQQQQQSNTVITASTSVGTVLTNPSIISTSPMLVGPSQSQLVNLAQLQAIMAALAAGGTMSIPTQTVSVGNTSTVSGAIASASALSGSAVHAGQTQTTTSTTNGESGSNSTQLGANQLLMNHHPITSANTSPHGATVESTGSAAMLVPTLNSLNSVCGLTLTTNPVGLSTPVSTSGAAITSALGNSTSSVGGSMLTGQTASLKGISLPSVDVQLGSATGLVNGTLNVLDSNSQALLAAAAASGHMGHVALANLRSSHGSAALRPIGTAPNGPVIGLLDPRTGLQFSVATTTSALLATPELVSCLQRGVYTSHPTDDSSAGTTRLIEVPTASTVTANPATTSTIATTTNITASSSEAKTSSSNIMRSVTKQSEVDSVSPYDSHGMEEDWDTIGPSDDTVAVQVNLQSIYAGIKSDPTSGSSLSSLNPTSLLPASGTGGGGGGGGSTRRHTGSSRNSGLTGSSRRSANTSGDLGGTHQGRPHRQNFTPTQNRILTEWYSKHKAKPYPSTDDTKELATISGLSYSQVKKWFANKRARSSSSGFPKPTPPLAPDSSPDPTAAKAIVAAAMAAAASSSSGLDSNERSAALQPAFLIASQALTSVAARMSGSSIEVDDDEPETALETTDVDEGSAATENQTPQRASSCVGDAVTLLSVSTEDEELPLMVVSETSAPSVSSTNKETSVAAPMDDISATNEVECVTSKSDVPSDEVTPVGLKFTRGLQSASSNSESPVASPPTLEVPLKSSRTPPVNGFSSENSPTTEVAVEDLLETKTSDSETSRTECDEQTVSLKNSKSLRTRGVTVHAS